MSALSTPILQALSDRLLADAGVAAIVVDRVFVPHQAFALAYPRVTLAPPQILREVMPCAEGSEVFLTIDCWAQGPDASHVAGDLADAVRAALVAPLTLSNHRVATQTFEHARPVGDPDPSVEHVVCVVRLVTYPPTTP